MKIDFNIVVSVILGIMIYKVVISAFVGWVLTEVLKTESATEPKKKLKDKISEIVNDSKNGN